MKCNTSSLHSCLCIVTVLSVQIAHGHDLGLEDIVALLQSSVHIKQQAPETPGLGTPRAPTLSYVSKLEELVLSRVREARILSSSAEDARFAEDIMKMITNMQSSILAGRSYNQDLVERSLANFANCTTQMWASYSLAIKDEEQFAMLSNVNKECQREEKDIDLSVDGYEANWQAANAALEAVKRRIEELQQTQEPTACTSVPQENYEEKLRRLSRWFGESYATMAALDDDKKQKLFFLDANKTIWDERIAMLRAMTVKCLNISAEMDAAKCRAIDILDKACTARDNCWWEAETNYKSVVMEVKVQEKDMKVEWGSLGRMQCYLRVLESSAQNVTLETCVSTPISSDHLSILYGTTPKKLRCPRDRKCPCNKEFLAEEYRVSGTATRCSVCSACRS